MENELWMNCISFITNSQKLITMEHLQEMYRFIKFMDFHNESPEIECISIGDSRIMNTKYSQLHNINQIMLMPHEFENILRKIKNCRVLKLNGLLGDENVYNELCEIISEMQNLDEIYFGCMKITETIAPSLANSILKAKISSLSFNNSLSIKSAEILFSKPYEFLTKLSITRNTKLETTSYEIIFESLKECKIIEELILHNSRIYNPACIKLGELLANKKIHIKLLDLFDCQIQDEGAKYIFNGLLENGYKYLKSLDLNANAFGKDIKELCKFITCTKVLENIDLSSNNFNEITRNEIFIALKANKSIKKFIFNYPGKFTETNALLFGESLQYNNSLQILSLSFFASDFITTVLQSLNKNNFSNISHLCISMNNIDFEKIMDIGKSIVSNDRLQILNLSKTKLFDKDIDFIHDGLLNRKMPMKKLNLAYNHLTCLSIKKIADLACSKIINLNLKSNEIQQTGTEILAKSLQNKNSILKILNISSCKIAFDPIISILNNNKSLTKIKIAKNNLKEFEIKNILENLFKNNRIIYLDISYNIYENLFIENFLSEKGYNSAIFNYVIKY